MESINEKQLQVVKKVSKLVSNAVEKSLNFAEIGSTPNQPNIKSKGMLAYNAGKDLMAYFKSEDNQTYFSAKARKNISDICEIISVCVQKMDVAMNGNLDINVWNKYVERLRRVKVLKDELDAEFQEVLTKQESA